MMKACLTALAIILRAETARAAFITFGVAGATPNGDPTTGLMPSDRSAWTSWTKAGRQSVGGIPTTWTQCGSTLTPSGGDDTSAIQAAINACTPNHYVQLSLGTFTIGEGNFAIIAANNIAVKGSGPCAGSGISGFPTYPSSVQSFCTLIRRSGGAVLYNQGGGTPSFHFLMGASDQYGNVSWGTTTSLAANGAQGASTIQVVSTTGFSVGQDILLDESANLGWQTTWIPYQGGSTLGWSSVDYRMNWLAQDPTCSPADKYCSGGATDPGIPCFFNWHNAGCSSYVNEIKQIASIGAGPCPGTNCTITFDDPLMISYRTANSAQVSVLYGGTSGTQQAYSNIGLESMTLQNADDEAIMMGLCNYCWVKNVEVNVMCSNQTDGAIAISAGFRDQLEGVYIHDGSHPYPGGAGYNISLDIGTSEALIENSISMTNDKMMVARMGGSGSVVAYSYFDEAICGGCSGQTEDGVNSSHWLGPHHVLFEGNWTFQASNDPVWGPTIFDSWMRNYVPGYRTTFFDGADGFTINDSTGAPNLTCSGQHNCAGGVNMAFADYWQSFVGNVIGHSGLSGWTYFTPGSPNVIWQAGQIGNGESAYDTEVWTQQAGAAAANCKTTSGDQCPLIRYYNYDYVTNSVNDPGVGTALPNSFVFASAPAYFSAGSGYAWPWVTPTSGTKVQVGPTTSACTTNVGGPCSGLPAKARIDNGTPFVQP